MIQNSNTQKHIADFLLEDHGSVLFLHPQNKSAEAWINASVSSEGYQPQWPSVLMDRRYAQAVVEGVQSEGFTVAYGQTVQS
jgi:hypothetical protein